MGRCRGRARPARSRLPKIDESAQLNSNESNTTSEKTHATATNENFTREMTRTSRRATKCAIPATNAKMLKKTANTENQFINQK